MEGDPLTAVLVGNVTHGTLALNPNGGFTYLSATNYNGSDAFTYRANDGTTNGNLATVTINITPVYDPVIAVNDSTNTLEDTGVAIQVLANDYNPDGLPLTITGTSTTNGTAVISGTNVVFTASTNFNGLVVFSYTVFDGTTSSTGKVTVTVIPVNDPPVAVNDTYTTLEDVRLKMCIRDRSYSLQRTADSSGQTLPASPEHLVKMNVSVPVYKQKIFASLEYQYTSSRRTLFTTSTGETMNGMDAGGFETVNFTLFSRDLIKNLEFSGSVYNLFDTRYGDPSSPFHLQDIIEQDGRSFRLKLTYRF